MPRAHPRLLGVRTKYFFCTEIKLWDTNQMYLWPPPLSYVMDPPLSVTSEHVSTHALPHHGHLALHARACPRTPHVDESTPGDPCVNQDPCQIPGSISRRNDNSPPPPRETSLNYTRPLSHNTSHLHMVGPVLDQRVSRITPVLLHCLFRFLINSNLELLTRSPASTDENIPFNAGVDFRRQNLTAEDVRLWRLNHDIMVILYFLFRLLLRARHYRTTNFYDSKIN